MLDCSYSVLALVLDWLQGFVSSFNEGWHCLAIGCSDNSVHVWDMSNSSVLLQVRSPGCFTLLVGIPTFVFLVLLNYILDCLLDKTGYNNCIGPPFLSYFFWLSEFYFIFCLILLFLFNLSLKCREVPSLFHAAMG
jgi:WD40 repeat protein